MLSFLITFIFGHPNITDITSIIQTLAVVAAFWGLSYTIRKDQKQNRDSRDNLKLALENEIWRNTEMLFSNKHERVFISRSMNELGSQYVKYVRDITVYENLQRLYSELAYYQNFVSMFYSKRNLNKARDKYADETVARQCEVMRVFLHYFYVPVVEGSDLATRDRMISIMHGNYSAWRQRLAYDIERIMPNAA